MLISAPHSLCLSLGSLGIRLGNLDAKVGGWSIAVSPPTVGKKSCICNLIHANPASQVPSLLGILKRTKEKKVTNGR